MRTNLSLSTILSSLTLFIPMHLWADTLTVEDFLSQVNAKTDRMAQFREVLNDPDGDRSLAAMQVMLESGDDALKDAALEYGLYSPNVNVQSEAIKGYLNSGPNLAIVLNGSALQERPLSYFYSSIRGLGGSTSEEKMGYVAIAVGDFQPEENCWYGREVDECVIRLSGTTLSTKLGNSWGQGNLNEQGQIQGSQNILSVDVGVPFVATLHR